MKFGKRIRAEATEQWADHYLDYKDLKHKLKALVEDGAPAASEEKFRSAILAEIDKVDRFFLNQETELYTEFRSLCQEASTVKVDHSPERAAASKCKAGHLRLDALVSSLEGTSAGKMIQSLLQFSAKVDSLRKFVMLNSLAVIKITKKHDKQSAVQLRWEMIQHVHRRHFYSSRRFGSLITDVEVLASEVMHRVTLFKPLPESYSCPICLGLLCNPQVSSCVRGLQEDHVEMEEVGMEVRPRLKRRSVGQGGKQALGGRPQTESELQAPPILLNAALLRSHFNLPLNDAARRLGRKRRGEGGRHSGGGEGQSDMRKEENKEEEEEDEDEEEEEADNWTRKLKAVEKRLALLQAEHKYVSEETLFAKYQAEIKELEEKRDKLLQGLDCDVADVADAEDAKKSVTPSRKVKVEPSTGLRSPTSSSRTYPLSPARETLDEDDEEEEEEEDLGEMPAAVEQEGIAGGGDGAEQDVWEMLHRMVSEEGEDTLGLNEQAKAHPAPTPAPLPASAAAQDVTCSLPPSSSGPAPGTTDVVDEYRDLRAQLVALQEEILHLRQFSMALLKERGDIASQLQGREEEIRDLQQRCHSLESQLILARTSDHGSEELLTPSTLSLPPASSFSSLLSDKLMQGRAGVRQGEDL
ncbi:hypothetical protein GUITHDRAFT_147735 [Guillardia theta CCMP2712]|uniref:SPX domain-containing protein n=1 Tax=Guillardia theta (strain CCMP2712) TaxID=905079 RepID=L1ICU6_GUITC|nr:hypothetical protein GUITHDRAFT_147735 [Guillardia theta CCMP2712]EKX33660.1 hypothetical protein GUITHDRAFT_147735 [Guillardia theta CCMP2712]|eukprot:XP_005820640.1 hypothetical protein GUITHDRAFT_147735 [Guillardia theta CCMP2712]